MINSATLTRLPERTPLPVSAITIDTDADSWCWGLSATLHGPEAWGLLRPQAPGFLPREVEATINGHTWQFLLDQVPLGRQFGRTSMTLRGRSRSAWLASPYCAAETGTVSASATAQQLAEQALADSGWSLDWQLPDWLIPGGLLYYQGTPIERLAQLLAPVSGCLSSHPSASVLSARLRYPVPAWELAARTADVGIPEAAILAWSQQPEARPLYNAVYVSGTSHGVLAHVVIAGTAGDLQADSVSDPLLADADAIAARARGVAILSASGLGYSISADTLLTTPTDSGPGLVVPGVMVQLHQCKGWVRGTRISADLRGNALSVRQTLTIEHREAQ